MAEKKEENRRGAEIVKEILKMVREKGPLTETQLAKEIALDRKQTSKYTTYLSTKGLVKVEKKLFGEPIISPASKDILVKTASKDNDTKPQKRKEGVKKVSAEDEKDVKDIYESLMEDFRGVMRLHSESDGDYIAALLLDSGNIMSATFEKEGSEKEEIGDHALKSIIETFSGTSGELEIYEMEEDKFNETMRENISYTLTKSFPLTNLKLKIKLMAKKQEKEDSKGLTSFVSRIKLKNATEKERKRMGFLHGRLDESVKLLDFARKAREKPGREESEEEKAKKEELKRKMREKGATTLKIPQIKKQPDDVKPLIIQGENPGADDKTPVKKVQEGKKVETTIDRFYQTIKKEEHLKINDLLSKKLKIDRTKLEQWSLILEEHNLIELHYPAIGEPEAIYVKKKGNDGGEAGDGKKG